MCNYISPITSTDELRTIIIINNFININCKIFIDKKYYIMHFIDLICILTILIKYLKRQNKLTLISLN